MKKLNVIALSIMLIICVASGTALSQTVPQAAYTGVTVESVVMGSGDVLLTLYNGKLNNVQYADGSTANTNTPGIETIINVAAVGGFGVLRINNFTVPAAACDNTQPSVPFTGSASIEITDPNSGFNYLTASLSVTFYDIGSNASGGIWSLHPAGFIVDPNDPATLNLTVANPTNTGPGNESRFIDELEASLSAARLAGFTMVLTPIVGDLCSGGIFNAQGVIIGAAAEPEFEARTIGYWKNHETQRDNVITTAVALSDVFSTEDELEAALLKKGKKSMLEKARQQFAALLLNCASGSNPSGVVLTAGELEILQLLNPSYSAGATLQDAKNEIEIAILTSTDLEHAKDLADEINNRDND